MDIEALKRAHAFFGLIGGWYGWMEEEAHRKDMSGEWMKG
jgi:hypothetical protein